MDCCCWDPIAVLLRRRLARSGPSWLSVGRLSTSLCGARIDARGLKLDPSLLGTDVELGSLAVNLCRGQAQATDVVIHNPTGFDGDFMLRAGSVVVQVDVKRLIGSRGSSVTLRQLLIQGLAANVVKLAWTESSNIQQWAESLTKVEASKSPSLEAQEPQRQWTLRKVAVRAIVAHMRKGSIQTVSAAVDDIEYDDFEASQGGLGTSHLYQLVAYGLLGLLHVAAVDAMQGAVAGAAAVVGLAAEHASNAATYVADGTAEHVPAAAAYVGGAATSAATYVADGTAEHVPAAATYVGGAATSAATYIASGTAEHVPAAVAFVGSAATSAVACVANGASSTATYVADMTGEHAPAAASLVGGAASAAATYVGGAAGSAAEHSPAAAAYLGGALFSAAESASGAAAYFGASASDLAGSAASRVADGASGAAAYLGASSAVGPGGAAAPE